MSASVVVVLALALALGLAAAAAALDGSGGARAADEEEAEDVTALAGGGAARATDAEDEADEVLDGTGATGMEEEEKKDGSHRDERRGSSAKKLPQPAAAEAAAAGRAAGCSAAGTEGACSSAAAAATGCSAAAAAAAAGELGSHGTSSSSSSSSEESELTMSNTPIAPRTCSARARGLRRRLRDRERGFRAGGRQQGQPVEKDSVQNSCTTVGILIVINIGVVWGRANGAVWGSRKVRRKGCITYVHNGRVQITCKEVCAPQKSRPALSTQHFQAEAVPYPIRAARLRRCSGEGAVARSSECSGGCVATSRL